MEMPQIRPGKVRGREPLPKVVAFFRDASLGNAAIQLAGQLGVPGDRIGVTPPERMPQQRGMIVVLGCPSEAILERVEAACRRLGGEIHRQRT
ncbi:MAG: hypothetical protein KatS3mg108_2978 [Isosphaeraceae bacterium]|jgi:hypothetical protein|nr:MAG: hypothetical protein KatS3mg108_2978 [Isosphaeraceae bacterium]